jgi:hypothetical protein
MDMNALKSMLMTTTPGAPPFLVALVHADGRRKNCSATGLSRAKTTVTAMPSLSG